MATDIAANSDSTLTYSQGESSPVRTLSESASTMWVWGEIGYAQITSGRQRAIASATAWEPSFCSSKERLLLRAHEVERRLGGGHVRVAHLARGTSGAPRRPPSRASISPLSAANPPSSTALGIGRPTCSRARSVAGTVSSRS